MAEREAVELGVGATQRNAQFFQQAAQTNRASAAAYVSDGLTDVMGSLAQFAGTLSEQAQVEVERQVEEDKIKQSTTAAQDVWKAQDERQGISQDATVAGRLAYNTILSKHDTLEANNRLVQLQQDNPDMSPEDFQKAQQKEYQGLLDKYGVDKYTMKEASFNIQESQQALIGVTEGIRKQYTTAKREEALNISIQDLLGDPNASADHIINNEIPARARMMGVSEFSMKKMLMQSAVTQAGQGDKRLLDQLDQTDWSKGSQLLKTGHDQYDQWHAREMAPMIGDAMGSLELAAVNGEASWGSTLKKIENMNKEFPGSYSAHAIAGLKLRMDSAAKARAKETQGLGLAMQAVYNQDSIPLGLNQTYSEKERNKIATTYEASLALKSREMIGQGQDAQQVSDWALKQQVAWSRANRMKLPALASTLEAAIAYNPDDYKGVEQPPYIKQQLATLKALDPQTLGVYLGEKDQTFARNFQSFSRNMDDSAAFRRAMNIRQNPYSVDGTMRMNQQAATAAQVEEVLDPAWYTKLFGTAKEVPAWQRDQLSNRWNREAESSLYAGGRDPKMNAESVVKQGMSQSSQTFNGTIVNVPPSVIRHGLSADDKPVSQAQANDALEAYTIKMLPELRKEYGQDIDMENLSFDFNKDGSAFRIYDNNGEQIGGTHLSHDAATIGKAANMEELRKTVETGRQKAKRTSEESTQALYRQLNGGLFNQEAPNRFD
ncbi:hypothetical protein [Pseudomonas phage Achelous]|uniref:Uncharacterized protein n=1 Tax=Pseudomonas phage Achelous TaxID=2163982 RepID=A0A2S1GMY7_9CAUD|nr:lysozyme domain-containing protein [Pseudomonas phage Achelous]AWD90713.1 hypothetical protein [Pseudomonas phage Achelous]